MSAQSRRGLPKRGDGAIAIAVPWRGCSWPPGNGGKYEARAAARDLLLCARAPASTKFAPRLTDLTSGSRSERPVHGPGWHAAPWPEPQSHHVLQRFRCSAEVAQTGCGISAVAGKSPRIVPSSAAAESHPPRCCREDTTVELMNL